MIVIVFLGLAFAVLAMFAIFMLMFIEVAFKPPQASANLLRSGRTEFSEPLPFTGGVVRSHERIQEVVGIVASGTRPLPQVVRSDTGVAINL